MDKRKILLFTILILATSDIAGIITSIMLFSTNVITLNKFYEYLLICILVITLILMPIAIKINVIKTKEERKAINSKLSTEFHRIWPKQSEDLFLQAVFRNMDIYMKSSDTKKGFVQIQIKMGDEKKEFEIPIKELTKYF